MTQIQTLDDAFRAAANRYRYVAIGDLKWSRERVFVQGLIAKSPKLKHAIPETVCDAILHAGSIGLTFNPAKQLCYLIPRGIKRGSDVQIAYASPSYRGLIALAVGGQMIQWAKAEIVFDADHFEDLGPLAAPEHRPASGRNVKRTEKDAFAVYCVAKLHDGTIFREIMDRDQVYKVRFMSEQPGSLMWDPEKFWHEGWKKAVLRRASKTWPATSEAFDIAIDNLNRNEGIIIEGEKADAPVETITKKQKQQLHDLLEHHQIDKGKRAKWFGRLATYYGVTAIEHLPASNFDECRQFLEEKLIEREST